MKRNIMVIAATIIASFVITATYSQTESLNKNVKYTVVDGINSVVNSKVQNKFQKNFPGADKISWLSSKSGTYEVHFSNKGVETFISYSNGGRVNYLTEIYNADRLNRDIKAQVSNAFNEYDITKVIEVHANNETGYLVYIQSKKFSKILRINDGGMEVYQDTQIAF